MDLRNQQFSGPPSSDLGAPDAYPVARPSPALKTTVQLFKLKTCSSYGIKKKNKGITKAIIIGTECNLNVSVKDHGHPSERHSDSFVCFNSSYVFVLWHQPEITKGFICVWEPLMKVSNL